MFGEGWGGQRPAFGWAGRDPEREGPWQPWADEEDGEPMGHHGPQGHHGHHGHHGPHGYHERHEHGGPRGPWDWFGPGRAGGDFARGFFGEGGPRPFGGPPPFGPWAWRMARRFGPGMGPGFGPGGPGSRMFGRGDLKFALLDLLRERPKHGYEMIKDLEDRSGGFYSPSAGAIYPTLQLLEDRGWVTAQTVEGKKVYAISDAGREALNEHTARHDEERDRGFRGGHGFRHGGRGRGPFGWNMPPELRDVGRESMEVAHLMRAAVATSANDPERLRQLRAIVERTQGELRAFLEQGHAEQPPRGEAPAGDAQGPVEEL
jgi:DNA-binding PadR family transcriptional regulator